MLGRDKNAGFIKTGVWIFSRYRLRTGGLEATLSLGAAAYKRLTRRQLDVPVLVLRDDTRRRSWWMFHGDFFCDEDELSGEEVQALLLEREDRRTRRVQHAVALMQRQSPTAPAPSREAIPGVVMRAVWRRDGGRCVLCGGREHLEFDHIIPVSLGGATTARNLQLLCAACNRRKGASLG